jgi:GPH family glycoside/pentoside/hexuronide:cation symporter
MTNKVTEKSESQSSPWVLSAYSGITMPMAAMGMPVAVYLPRFYSEGMGLSLATVGLIFTLARVWDVVTDPLMGMAIDKFETRWGRRKHWVALSIPILMLAVWMVFMPNPESVTPMYLVFWLLILYIGYTMLVISHLSWGAELSTSYDARSRLFGWREIFTIAGMTIVLAIPAFLELNGQSDQQSKVASMGWFCLILFPLLVIPVLVWVPDTKAGSSTSIPWRQAMNLIIKNRVMWRLLVADLATGLGTAVSGALYIFFAAAYFQLPEHASVALLFYFLASFLAMPLWLKLAYKVGKDNALKIALVYAVTINLGVIPFAEAGNVAVLWVFTIFYGVAFGAAPTLLRSMMADLTDEDELKTGQKRSGLFFALLTTTSKAGAAFGVGMSFTVLELVFGFQPGSVNTPEALEGLLLTYTVGFALPMFIAYFALINYPMTREKHGIIVDELRNRESAGPVSG